MLSWRSLALSLLAATAAVPNAHAADAGALIVLNKDEATASVIDRSSGKIIATLPTGIGPHEAAISPDGRTAVLCNYGDRTPGNSLTVVDMVELTVRKTIDLGEYRRPHGIAFVPDGNSFLVTSEANQALLHVDLASGTILRAYPTDAKISHMLALTPGARRAYVANIGSGSVTVFDLERHERLAEIATGEGAEGIDVSPDGRELWVANRAADSISIVDPETNTITATLACPSFPIRVKFTPAGDRVLVSNARTGDVVVFDARERREIARVAMAERAGEEAKDRLFGDTFGDSPVPVGILIPPDGREAFVANTNADVITVIDLEKLAISRRLRAGKEPDGMAWTPLSVNKRSGIRSQTP